MLKRIFALLKEFLKKCFAVKHQALPDELLPVLKSAEELVNILESEYKQSTDDIFEYAKALEYSRIIRGNVRRMMNTTDVHLFSISYEDALWFADALCTMRCICAAAAKKSDAVKALLKNMQKRKMVDIPAELVVCRVVFGRGTKQYDYLAPKDRFAEGEYVIAPVGYDMKEKVVRIVKIRPAVKSKPAPTHNLKYVTKTAIYELDQYFEYK